MASKKSPRRVVARQQERQRIEKQLGTTCTCGHRARRRSDAFCTACGTALVQSVSPDVIKAYAVRAADTVKAAVSHATGAADSVGTEISRLHQETMRTGAKIAALEAMANGMHAPYRHQIGKAAAPAAEFDPLAVLTVDGREPSTDPLLRAELSSHDPARREAAWQAIFGERS